MMAISLTTTAWAQTVEGTYVGRIEYQDQTITKATSRSIASANDLATGVVARTLGHANHFYLSS
jgi:hypothetical protein